MGKECKGCLGCSYYELTCIGMLPFEYCYKHDKDKDLYQCEYYTHSFYVKFRIIFSNLFRFFKEGLIP